ncbi:Next to BRCA1 protein 1 protein [Phytophthora boehmeriae]|uniref:Next to BRCA1 protein 1 protein n=1 Tax=Phytophthora boehmeriae TaxID=109152 RepID=A0A8T1WZ28_9STRA|nr:Next to BRCA1 protein 1 protein [Phytophthora boehmeriae]
MWRLVNDGERSWPDGCYMTTQRGNPMTVDGGEASRIELPALNPGEESIVGVDLVAPSEPGRYTSFWRVCDPADVSFGHRFWVDIVVANGMTVDEVAAETTPVSSAFGSEDESEDTEMKDTPEALVPAESASDDDLEIIEAADAQEAEAVADEPENEKKDDKMEYEEALRLLATMGFTDTEKNMRALTLADGNIGAAVNALLSE